MYTVYVLKDDKGRLYIGRTSDPDRRLKEHFSGKVWTTIRMDNVELVFLESFKAKTDAIRRERYLKTNKGKKGLRLVLRNSLK